MGSATPREVHILGGSMVWHASADASICLTACGATARRVAQACRSILGEGFAVLLHLTPSAVGAAGGAEVAGDLGPLADRLLVEDRTAVVFIATALCGASTPKAPPARAALKCLPSQPGAPTTDALLARLRQRRPGVVFAALTTTDGDPATAIRERAGCDLVMAVDVRTGACVVSGGPEGEADLNTQERELAVRTLVERARALAISAGAASA